MILKKKLDNFEKFIKFNYKNKQNLINALIHPSYIQEKKSRKKTERILS